MLIILYQNSGTVLTAQELVGWAKLGFSASREHCQPAMSSRNGDFNSFSEAGYLARS
jgi:hypothetical protein